MSTFLFSEHIFGPIKSRRLGMSLGINLLSTSQKVCNYDCIYCECGLTTPSAKLSDKFVDSSWIISALEERFSSGNISDLDAITYAGNGEPTLHPDFLRIAKNIALLRDKYYPHAQIVLLTNGSTFGKPGVQNALKFIDKTAVKLDAGNDEDLHLIDRPLGRTDISKLVEQLKLMPKVTIQTMFLKGKVNGKKVDNTDCYHLDQWIRKIQEIMPAEVMIYSLDRDTPFEILEQVPRSTLEKIANRVRELKIDTQVV